MLKRSVLMIAALGLALAVAGPPRAHAGVVVSVGVGPVVRPFGPYAVVPRPYYRAGFYYGPRPYVAYYPRPYVPAPVWVRPAPVYYRGFHRGGYVHRGYVRGYGYHGYVARGRWR
ncbi:MAG TPA: hypothetical protein VLV49_05705 [Terriglobales bacterium]|nr:hypothetical protein [Terriglobales bacterium]